MVKFSKKWKTYNKHRKQALAAKVTTLATKVRRMSPENKYADINILGQTFNYTPTNSYVQNLFSGMSQGTSDANAYTGDQIFLKSIKIKGTFYNTGTVYQLCRIVCVMVKKNMEGLITTANGGNLIMESAYSTGANAFNAPLDHDNRKGVTVLFDQRIVMNPQLSSATNSNQARAWSKNLTINKRIQFQNGGNVPTENGIYLFFISDNSSQGYMNYIARLNYTDV